VALVFANSSGATQDALQLGEGGIDGGRGFRGFGMNYMIGTGVFRSSSGGEADRGGMGCLAFEVQSDEVNARRFVAENFCGLFIGMGADFVLGGESFAGEDQTGGGHIHH